MDVQEPFPYCRRLYVTLVSVSFAKMVETVEFCFFNTCTSVVQGLYQIG